MKRKGFKNVFILWTVLFLLGGAVPVFSQQILASYGLGFQSLDYKGISSLDDTVSVGMTWEGGVLFVGSDLAVSLGVSVISDFTDNINVDPVFGMGYVYYDTFYVGGIFNIIPKPYSGHPDLYMAPTLVGGYDFGSFFVGGQVIYMYGFVSSITGFKFSLNVGVNVGRGK
jgi:hypothetical protein